MNEKGPQWVIFHGDNGGEMSLGFKTLEYAEGFIRSQSNKTEYHERWTFRLYENEVYGTSAIATMGLGNGQANLDLRKL